jgi:hypothetical protein
MIFVIINYVLDLTPQAPIKPNNLVFLILNYPTTKHTFLQLLALLLDYPDQSVVISYEEHIYMMEEAHFPHHDPPAIVPAAGGLPTMTQRTSSTMMRLMHSSAIAFCVIIKVWEVIVDVVLMLLSKIMILMLR